MTQRLKIFIAYCYPDQKWLQRVRTAMAPMPPEDFVVWDDRKFRAGNAWKNELSAALAEADLAVMLVSDIFLDSDFVARANFPALLAKARREGGPRLAWVLVSHCLHEAAGLNPAYAVNDLDNPLDGISASRRDAAVAIIAAKLRALAAGEKYVPPAPPAPAPTGRRGSKASAAPPPPPPEPVESPYSRRLGQLVQARFESVAQLRTLERWMLWAALGFLILSPPASMARGNFLLLPLIAGFSILLATLALVLRTRTDLLAHSITGIQYIRTSFEDEALPGRQRNLLKQKAGQLLGEA